MKSRKHNGLWVLVARAVGHGFALFCSKVFVIVMAFVSFCVVAYRLEESWKRDIINGSQQIQP